MNKQENNEPQKPLMCSKNIIRIDGGKVIRTTDIVITEFPLKISVNGKHYSTLYCTPQYINELAVGHLYTTGKMKSKQQLIKTYINGENASIQLDSNISGICTNNPEPCKISHDTVLGIVEKTLTYSKLFSATGGVHCVGLFKDDNEVIIIEDVARHNAVDKVIGYSILRDIPLSDKIIVFSGRISYDMLSKVISAGIKIILSKSAPTNLSLDLAITNNITIAGFIRNNRMNVYCGNHRIILTERESL